MNYLVDPLSQLTGSVISDPFNRAPHIMVKRIAVMRVWKPHIRGNMIKIVVLQSLLSFSSCVIVIYLVGTYIVFLVFLKELLQFKPERFSSHSDLVQRCAGHNMLATVDHTTNSSKKILCFLINMDIFSFI